VSRGAQAARGRAEGLGGGGVGARTEWGGGGVLGGWLVRSRARGARPEPGSWGCGRALQVVAGRRGARVGCEGAAGGAGRGRWRGAGAGAGPSGPAAGGGRGGGAGAGQRRAGRWA
jgi:hypothetical protein